MPAAIVSIITSHKASFKPPNLKKVLLLGKNKTALAFQSAFNFLLSRSLSLPSLANLQFWAPLALAFW